MKTVNSELKKTMVLAEKAMQPYQKQMESNEGILAMMQIQTVAFLMRAGLLEHKDMVATIQDCTNLINVPEHVLRLHANLTISIANLADNDAQSDKEVGNG